jgi:D-hydroxyproline dehydrogenase subunit beta
MKKYDLIVVGGGVLGTFHAFHAARKGKKVLILEKDNRPVGSTVQNFGQVVPSGLAGKWFELGRRSLAIYREIQQATDISVRANGSVYLASDEDEWQMTQEMSEIHTNLGYENLLLSSKGIKDKFPNVKSGYAIGGIYYPQDLSVEPHMMIYKLLEFVQGTMGVEVLTSRAVIACDETSDGVEVTVAGMEKYAAGKVIICSGYVFNLLFPEIYQNSGLIVSKLQMLKTHTMPEIKLNGNILTGLTTDDMSRLNNARRFQNCKHPNICKSLRSGVFISFSNRELMVLSS